MMEALVISQHKGLKFEHTNNVHWRHGDSHAEISHVFEPESRHVMNMVTYIIYINEKQQNSTP